MGTCCNCRVGNRLRDNQCIYIYTHTVYQTLSPFQIAVNAVVMWTGGQHLMKEGACVET